MKYHLIVNQDANAVVKNGGRDLKNMSEEILGPHLGSVSMLAGQDIKGAIYSRMRQSERASSVVLACGGDGTARTGTLASKALNHPLGILPGGTFNSLAQSLGFKNDLQASLQLYAGAQLYQKRIDTGRVNGNTFLSTLSLYGGECLSLSLKDIFRARGVGAYINGLKGVFDFVGSACSEPEHYEFCFNRDMDGENEIHSLDQHDVFRAGRILITNGEFEPHRALHHLARTPRDLCGNNFGVYAASPENWSDLAKLSAALVTGKWALSSSLQVFNTKSLQVRSTQGPAHSKAEHKVELDGEQLNISGQDLQVTNHKADIEVSLPQNLPS